MRHASFYLVILAAPLLLYQMNQIVKLRRELAHQQQAAGNAGSTASAEEPSEHSEAEIEQWRRDAAEVHKLRAEVARLRREAQEMAKSAAKPPPAAPQPAELPEAVRAERIQAAQEKQRAETDGVKFVEKMNGLKAMTMAFRQFAQSNNGSMPAGLNEAVGFLPKEYTGSMDWENYEITFSGRIEDLEAPQRVIVVKEKTPTQTADGKWAKAYGFADGHSEVHLESDPEVFENWEKTRLASGKNP